MDEQRPEWMSDPLVKSIEERKLRFLSELVLGSRGKNQKEVMSYMMIKMKQAKAEQLTFSGEELNAVITAIKNHSTPEELVQMEEILKKRGSH